MNRQFFHSPKFKEFFPFFFPSHILLFGISFQLLECGLSCFTIFYCHRLNFFYLQEVEKGNARKAGETPSVVIFSESCLFLSSSGIEFLKKIYRDGWRLVTFTESCVEQRGLKLPLIFYLHWIAGAKRKDSHVRAGLLFYRVTSHFSAFEMQLLKYEIP